MNAPLSEGLDILHVSKRYGAGDSALVVLDDVTLRVRPGEFVSVLGASGCGKSTLLRLIAGLDAGYSGAIMMRGERVHDTSLERGIVFQDHRLFPWLTASQNILAALRNAPLSEREKRDAVAAHIALVGLEGFENAYPHQLSGGMAQRVAIARGLVNRPRVLLLDEPFGALDALTRSRLQNELQRIWERERITMILVTHDVEEAIYLGERVVTMAPRPGRIRRIVDVALPRPRDRSDPCFVQLRDEVLAEFVGEHDATHDDTRANIERRNETPAPTARTA
ncbi:sulfonate transport system ATP-binding protein [Paraburkholderia caballeronis]|uniref:ABC transporter ATP-binding protein n=1 Tax=Paraburkholderia caballeronis TaxID=416943 RepID=UPI001065011D|nr:ABC transporter ATP-binding protein [Paraburkholderia caballeronis]TDV34139.1 sulfonate transport system ATP-binding protein [Paraburkholderia caballeronis]